MVRPPSDEDFAELVQASWPALYRTAYLLVGDHGLAEDLVQTSLAKTYAAWSRVREPAAAHGYARTVLVNTAHVVVPDALVARRTPGRAPPRDRPRDATSPTGRR